MQTVILLSIIATVIAFPTFEPCVNYPKEFNLSDQLTSFDPSITLRGKVMFLITQVKNKNCEIYKNNGDKFQLFQTLDNTNHTQCQFSADGKHLSLFNYDEFKLTMYTFNGNTFVLSQIFRDFTGLTQEFSNNLTMVFTDWFATTLDIYRLEDQTNKYTLRNSFDWGDEGYYEYHFSARYFAVKLTSKIITIYKVNEKGIYELYQNLTEVYNLYFAMNDEYLVLRAAGSVPTLVYKNDGTKFQYFFNSTVELTNDFKISSLSNVVYTYRVKSDIQFYQINASGKFVKLNSGLDPGQNGSNVELRETVNGAVEFLYVYNKDKIRLFCPATKANEQLIQQ